jgi:Protein of unknown function (DUF502)
MNNLFRAPIRTFVAGLIAVLPVVLTVAVIVWVASLIDQFIGPHSAVGRLLVSIGLTVVETKIAAYLIGIAFVLCAIYVLGLLVQAGLQRRLEVFVDNLLRRIPLVGSVYERILLAGRPHHVVLVPIAIVPSPELAGILPSPDLEFGHLQEENLPQRGLRTQPRVEALG